MIYFCCPYYGKFKVIIIHTIYSTYLLWLMQDSLYFITVNREMDRIKYQRQAEQAL